MPRCWKNSAYLRCGAVNRRLQSPLARDESNLPLSEPIKGVILTQNCREAGECRIQIGRTVAYRIKYLLCNLQFLSTRSVSEHGEYPPFDRSEHGGRLDQVGLSCRIC
jgi:hypothetical protein